ncbi:hypothetical protein [Endozoicomonas euniceicola]|uniref:Uncharacterized protein n=1 Tax=Endozoicomonas euniceicola TaxID=1234143 RepID=A0ABY6GQL4_9GAMM|nr:hypothetical protein [Endozoicomonas euniceicola]UYM15040.1 hypothetical protein NX720_19525 [Endozoicomonas euniceicola]
MHHRLNIHLVISCILLSLSLQVAATGELWQGEIIIQGNKKPVTFEARVSPNSADNMPPEIPPFLRTPAFPTFMVAEPPSPSPQSSSQPESSATTSISLFSGEDSQSLEYRVNLNRLSTYTYHNAVWDSSGRIDDSSYNQGNLTTSLYTTINGRQTLLFDGGIFTYTVASPVAFESDSFGAAYHGIFIDSKHNVLTVMLDSAGNLIGLTINAEQGKFKCTLCKPSDIKKGGSDRAGDGDDDSSGRYEKMIRSASYLVGFASQSEPLKPSCGEDYARYLVSGAGKNNPEYAQDWEYSDFAIYKKQMGKLAPMAESPAWLYALISFISLVAKSYVLP